MKPIQPHTKNHPNLAPFLRRIRPKMVIRRLWILGLWLFGTACILGPDIEVEEQESNSPPKIVLESLHPADDGTIMLDVSNSCLTQSLTFKVGLVRDRNVEDDLVIRWFLNWDANGNKDPSQGEYWDDHNIPQEGTVERTGRQWTLPWGDLPSTELYEVNTFRVLLADRPLYAGGNGAEFPEGSDGLYDVYQWTLINANTGYCDEQ